MNPSVNSNTININNNNANPSGNSNSGSNNIEVNNSNFSSSNNNNNDEGGGNNNVDDMTFQFRFEDDITSYDITRENPERQQTATFALLRQANQNINAQMRSL